MSTSIPPAPTNEISSEDKTMGMLCHLLVIFTYFVGPLILWLIKKDTSAFVDDQGKEALNFGITITIGWTIGVILAPVIVGFLILPVVGIYGLVMAIIACMQANQGVAYRYPITLRFIK